jgi:hypothetical protein
LAALVRDLRLRSAERERPTSTLLANRPVVLRFTKRLVLAAAISSGAGQMVQAALGGMKFGRYLATGAQITIMIVGVFAALNQLGIAPAIVNGLFYAQ